MSAKRNVYSRRSMLKSAMGLTVGTAIAGRGDLAVTRGTAMPASVEDETRGSRSRHFLGGAYWANRLQDWRLSDGRIECLSTYKGRTVALITRSLRVDSVPATIAARTGTLSSGPGFSGFLIGAGGGALDYRAAALCMAGSGTGGGLLCTYESDGHVRFRDHTDERNQFAYKELDATNRHGPHPTRTVDEDVLLTLAVLPTGGARSTLRLTATDSRSGQLLSEAELPDIEDALIAGGISLMSSPFTNDARYWFRSVKAAGPRVARSQNQAGPILGTLFSLSESVLKMSAFVMPIGADDPQVLELQIRPAGSDTWTAVQAAAIGAGYSAIFRVEDWDGLQAWDYRVIYGRGTAEQHTYAGTVPPDPVSKDLDIGMICCTTHAFRALDKATSGAPFYPDGEPLGLYTSNNLYFPYAEITTGLSKIGPDLLVALGDQFYENKPTGQDTSPDPMLDSLYKFYLWVWAFRDLTKSVPTVVLVDDHDVYHGNLWGWKGVKSPKRDYNYGGYKNSADWVNMIQRVQCGHNPDPWDDRPVKRGISVYYCAFVYGGVSFAIIEDRKFKNNNHDLELPGGEPLEPPFELLGARQEDFLSVWSTQDPDLPHICLTATQLSGVSTNEDGSPATDTDQNASIPDGRRRALVRLRDAHAILLSGDTHLPALVRNGIDTFTDGPMQFGGPAAGTAWQRWFEPNEELEHGTGHPYTGDYTDGWQNKCRVLAVSNPKMTFQEFRDRRGYANNDLGDRPLKSEGYGVVRVDKTNSRYVFNCWPWNADPENGDVHQYPGWPYVLPFDEA